MLNSWQLWLFCNLKSMWKTASGFHSVKWSIVLSFSFQLSLSEVFFFFQSYCFSQEALKCCRKESEDRGSQSWEWTKGRWLLKGQAKRQLMRKRENRVPVLCTVSWCLRIKHQGQIIQDAFTLSHQLYTTAEILMTTVVRDCCKGAPLYGHTKIWP